MSKRFFKNYQEFISETSSISTLQAPSQSNQAGVEPITDEVMVFSPTFSPDSDLEQINKNAEKPVKLPEPESEEEETDSQTTKLQNQLLNL